MSSIFTIVFLTFGTKDVEPSEECVAGKAGERAFSPAQPAKSPFRTRYHNPEILQTVIMSIFDLYRVLALVFLAGVMGYKWVILRREKQIYSKGGSNP